MVSVFDIIPVSQSLVLFHGVSIWSFSIEAVLGLIPWGQSLVFSMESIFGLIPWNQSLVLCHGVSVWSFSMGSVFGLFP
jgi:hypothetical protein